MNFASIACMVALCSQEYLLCFEDGRQWGQCAALLGAGQGEPRGGWPLPIVVTGFSYCMQKGNPLARWVKVSLRMPQAAVQCGSRREMEMSYTRNLTVMHVSWELVVLSWYKMSQTCITIKPHFASPWQAPGMAWNEKIMVMVPWLFFCCCCFPCIHWNRWLFLPRTW